MTHRYFLLSLVASTLFAASAVAGDVELPQRLHQPRTPRDMAQTLERDLAGFIGVFMPDTNRPFARYMGVLPLPSLLEGEPLEFPQEFFDGLVCVEEFGLATWPVTLRVDDATGDTVFYNGSNAAFWTEAPSDLYYQQDWIVRLYGREVSAWVEALLQPSHVAARWVFVAEEDVAAYHAARLERFGRASGGGTMQWGSARVPELVVTEYVVTEEAWLFSAAWNGVAWFPMSRMDVLFTSDLRARSWQVVGTVPVVKTGEARGVFFEVPRSAVAEELQVSPLFEHEALCEPATSVVDSPLVAGVSYTNVVCGCVRPKSPSGFFRLAIPDPSENIPAWWRVLHGFSPEDSWEDCVDFNGDGLSNMLKYGQGKNPVTPPGGGAGASIRYAYDDDDRLTAGFIGTDGAAAFRQLSPAGNPEVQQERSAP
jgi:hypothetical protein